LDRCKLFHTDSVFCGLSALAMKTNAPTILKAEALSSARSGGNNKPKEGYSRCLGSEEQVPFEKAVLANASAVREWDSNGTVFGYNASVKGHTAGEFGHNDFYSVVIAASH
jgi:2-methylcitrate dehydratase